VQQVLENLGISRLAVFVDMLAPFKDKCIEHFLSFTYKSVSNLREKIPEIHYF
jgi:hypothetical protein